MGQHAHSGVMQLHTQKAAQYHSNSILSEPAIFLFLFTNFATVALLWDWDFAIQQLAFLGRYLNLHILTTPFKLIGFYNKSERISRLSAMLNSKQKMKQIETFRYCLCFLFLLLIYNTWFVYEHYGLTYTSPALLFSVHTLYICTTHTTNTHQNRQTDSEMEDQLKRLGEIKKTHRFNSKGRASPSLPTATS